jgi:hypothetical protein
MKPTAPGIHFDRMMLVGLLLASTALCLVSERDIFRWPMTAEFPAILKWVDRSALATDFYTNAALASPKIIFGWLIATLGKIGGGWYAALTALHVLVQVTVRPLIYLLLESLGRWWKIPDSPRWRAVKLGAGVLLLANHFATVKVLLAGWDSFLSLPLSTPMIVSIWLSLLAVLAFVRQTGGLAMSLGLLVLATLIHPVLSLCTWAALGCLVLPPSDGKRAQSYLLQGLVGTLLPALIISRVFAPQHALSARDYIAAYVVDRHPHHYLMSASIYRGFWVFAALWTVPITLSLRLPTAYRWLAVTSGLSMGVAVLLQYVGTEVFPLKFIAEFGPSRYTCLMVMGWILVTALVLGGKSSPAVEPGGTWPERDPFVLALGLGCAVVLFWCTPRDPTWAADQAKALPVIEWIRAHTVETDVFLADDGEFNPHWIRILARRPIAADNTFPFTDDAIAEFVARRKIYQAFTQDRTGFLASPSLPFRCDYVVLGRDRVPPRATVVFATAEWAVMRFPVINTRAESPR